MNSSSHISKKAAIVLISNTHWHYSWQTGNSVAAGFAKLGYHVIFVEPIPKRWPRLAEATRVIGRLTVNSRRSGFVNQTIPEGVEIITPFTLPDVGLFAQGVNKLLFIPILVTQLKRHLKVPEPLVLVHTLPVKAAISLQKRLKPDVSIYRCVYDWTNDPYSQRELAEVELLTQVDMAWADCDRNLERIAVVQKQTVLMPPAVDLSLFTAVSYTRSGQSKPLCVYFGTVGPSIDLELLRKISHRYKLRIIGPIRKWLDGFASETEIIPAVPHDQIPNLVRFADILLLPYNDLPHMLGVIPAKLFECLITGKPVIATNLTTINQYRDLVYLCKDHDEVFHAIETALTEDESLPARRIACAEENSLDKRIMQMEHYIQTLLLKCFKKKAGL